jgi:hypothetical protein
LAGKFKKKRKILFLLKIYILIFLAGNLKKRKILFPFNIYSKILGGKIKKKLFLFKNI